MQLKIKPIKPFILLHAAVFILSLGTVCIKFAASKEVGSLSFFALYGGMLAALAIYAVIWQQVLKNISLTTAFINKSVALFWGLFWGATLFNEEISINMVVGIFVVFAGVILVVAGGHQDNKEVEENNE